MIFNEEKLAKLKRADEHFEECYGAKGTPSRIAFEEHALNWYYSEILKERRKELKITQKQLAEKVGKKREYIAILEKGETDMQLSTFLNISSALGLKFSIGV
jgi:DNA-binding XRE family transcriptional regulator